MLDSIVASRFSCADAVADYVGLDTCFNIMTGWVRDYPNDGWVVPPSLATMVADGKFGRKSGQGFYKWDGDKLA